MTYLITSWCDQWNISKTKPYAHKVSDECTYKKVSREKKIAEDMKVRGRNGQILGSEVDEVICRSLAPGKTHESKEGWGGELAGNQEHLIAGSSHTYRQRDLWKRDKASCPGIDDIVPGKNAHFCHSKPPPHTHCIPTPCCLRHNLFLFHTHTHTHKHTLLPLILLLHASLSSFNSYPLFLPLSLSQENTHFAHVLLSSTHTVTCTQSYRHACT